jgi:N-acetylglucosamine-6-phosphate deacetylase
MIKFENCRVLPRLERASVWVLDGRVIDPQKRFYGYNPSDPAASTWCEYVVDCENHILSPGFLDLQINGARGRCFVLPPLPTRTHL